jgi:hypothetical protein
MDNKKIQISINLAGRNIPLNIHPEYEGIVRKEVKRANDAFMKLKNNYDFNTETDALLMFLLLELVEKAVLKHEMSQLNAECDEAFEQLKRELEK